MMLQQAQAISSSNHPPTHPRPSSSIGGGGGEGGTNVIVFHDAVSIEQLEDEEELAELQVGR